MVGTKHDAKNWVLWSDEREATSNKFQSCLAENGVVSNLMNLYSWIKWVAEHKNRHLLEVTRGSSTWDILKSYGSYSALKVIWHFALFRFWSNLKLHWIQRLLNVYLLHVWAIKRDTNMIFQEKMGGSSHYGCIIFLGCTFLPSSKVWR